jgi:hypothetical protein
MNNSPLAAWMRLLDRPRPMKFLSMQLQGRSYSVVEISAPLHELTGWFADAHPRSTNSKTSDWTLVPGLACAVLAAPFRSAILISLDEAGGEHGRSVNVGLSPETNITTSPISM